MAGVAVRFLHGYSPLLPDALYWPVPDLLTAPVRRLPKRLVSPVGLGMRVLLLSGATLLTVRLESRIVLAYLGMPLAIFGPVLLACASSRVPGRVGHLISEVS